MDGIEINRVKNSLLMKIAPNDLIRNPLWWRLAFREGLKKDFDLIHCHDLDTLRSGVLLKRKRGKPLIFDAHEIFAFMIEEDVPRVVVRYAERMERDLLKEVDHIITVNEALKDYYEKNFEREVTVVMNCSTLVLDGYEPPKNDFFTILYVGTLHRSRFVSELIDVVAEMPDVRLKIGGEKALYSQVKERCERTRNSQFLGTVPLENVLPLTKECDAVFCMFDPNNRNNKVGSPNKIFEAMAMGRPVIATKGILSGEIVEREKCGLAVEYSKKALREAIETLKDNPRLCQHLGENGLNAAKREYNWKVQGRKLLEAVRQFS